MMDLPSAQSVGREFVRQYYTMLHEAPHFLHRFYSNNSSFVHGGVEKPGEEHPPALGQAEIHKRILSLNFIDCHVKIRQVDSQSSVEGSVVIQVVGELSNNGGPMRRFMQTFVLAPQSPKKYYLHNDIFRYQDEVFLELVPDGSDADGVGDAVAEQEVNEAMAQYHESPAQLHHQKQVEEPVMQQQLANSYNDQQKKISSEPGPEASSNGLTSRNESASITMTTVTTDDITSDASAQKINSTESTTSAVQTEAVDQSSIVAAEQVPGAQKEQDKSGVENAGGVVVTSQAEGEAVKVDGGLSEKDAETVQSVPAPKVMTWAALAAGKKTTASVAQQPAAAAGPKPHAAVRPEPKGEHAGAPNGVLPQRTPRVHQLANAQQQQQALASSDNAGPTPQSDASVGGPSVSRASTSVHRGSSSGVTSDTGAVGPRDGFGSDVEEASRARVGSLPIYPDSQQVFVGNVPHTVTDLDLKDYFEQYGRVVDIRINHKPSNNLPNFGFITYDSVEAVQNILSTMPLPKLFGKHRLNVEEKKPKDQLSGVRPGSGTRPPPGGRSPSNFTRPGPDAYPSRRGGASGGRGTFNGTGRGGSVNHNGAGSYSQATNTKTYTRSSSSDSRSGQQHQS